MAAAAARAFAAAYDRALVRHPTATKTATATAIACAGDALTQGVGPRPYDAGRTARNAAFTAAITPAVARWYLFLLARFPASPAARVACDQLLWAPAGVAAYFFSMEALAGAPLADAADAAQERTWPTLRANWLLWPAVQFANFSAVPPRYQVLVVNAVSFFWAAFISSVAHPYIVPAPAAALVDAAAPARPLPRLHHRPRAAPVDDTAPAPLEDTDGQVHARGEFGVHHPHSHAGHAMGEGGQPAADLRGVKVPGTQLLPVRPTAHPKLSTQHPERVGQGS
jgi:hypothetical protein